MLVSSPEIASAFADIDDVFVFTEFFTSESSALISVSSYNSSFADIKPSGLMVMLSPAVSLFCLLVSSPAIASVFADIAEVFVFTEFFTSEISALISVSS